MSKELDYIADLERENRLLGERCNQLLKDKGDLTDKIADIKANCDLAIEGRDIKIKELEQTNNKLLDVINNQDVKIADLEKQIEQIEKVSDYNADQLTKAKKLLEKWLFFNGFNSALKKETEDFLGKKTEEIEIPEGVR